MYFSGKETSYGRRLVLSPNACGMEKARKTVREESTYSLMKLSEGRVE
jgi:hypothetical protein